MNKILNLTKAFIKNLFRLTNLKKIIAIFLIGIIIRYLINNYYVNCCFAAQSTSSNLFKDYLTLSCLIYYWIFGNIMFFLHEFFIFFNIGMMLEFIKGMFFTNIPLNNLMKEYLGWIISKALDKKRYIFNMNPNWNEQGRYVNGIYKRYPSISNSNNNNQIMPDFRIQPDIYREMVIPDSSCENSPSCILGVKYSGNFKDSNFKSVYIKYGYGAKFPYYLELWKKEKYGGIPYTDFVHQFPKDYLYNQVIKQNTSEKVYYEIVKLMYGNGLNPFPWEMSVEDKCTFFNKAPFIEYGEGIVDKPNNTQDLFYRSSKK